MKYCQKCGTKMNDGDVFCAECAERSFNAAPAPAPVNQGYYYPVKKKKLNPLVIIIPAAAIVILAVLLIIVLTGGNNSPSAVVQRYFDACSRDDIDGILQCLEPAAAGQYGESASGVFAYYIGPDGYRIAGEEIDGDRADVEIEMTASADGAPLSNGYSIPCVKIDGQWYISTT